MLVYDSNMRIMKVFPQRLFPIVVQPSSAGMCALPMGQELPALCKKEMLLLSPLCHRQVFSTWFLGRDLTSKYISII